MPTLPTYQTEIARLTRREQELLARERTALERAVAAEAERDEAREAYQDREEVMTTAMDRAVEAEARVAQLEAALSEIAESAAMLFDTDGEAYEFVRSTAIATLEGGTA